MCIPERQKILSKFPIGCIWIYLDVLMTVGCHTCSSPLTEWSTMASLKNKGQKCIKSLMEHIQAKKQKGLWQGPPQPIPWGQLEWDPAFQESASGKATVTPPWRQDQPKASHRKDYKSSDSQWKQWKGKKKWS